MKTTGGPTPQAKPDVDRNDPLRDGPLADDVLGDDPLADDVPGAGRPAEVIALGGGLELRRRHPSQAAALNAAILANLEHLRPWVAWVEPAPSLADTLANCEHAVAQWEAGTGYTYVIQSSDAPDTVLGAGGLHARVGAGALEIGYWVDQHHTGQGVATALARGLTDQALALPDVHRVEIHVDEANAASSAVPRKLGYRLEHVRERAPEAPAQTGRVEVWVLGAPAGDGSPAGLAIPTAAAESLGL